MEYRPKGFLYFIASVALILVAIVATSIMNKSGGGGDIRARAGEEGALTFTATVTSVENLEGTLVIDNLMLEENNRSGTEKNLGQWRLMTPTRFNSASAEPGSKLTITVSGSGLDVPNRTINATEVKVTR